MNKWMIIHRAVGRATLNNALHLSVNYNYSTSILVTRILIP
jgi:hypothetical protein